MKRVFDCILASTLAVILLIPMVLLAIVIKLNSKGPIFFVSDRVGQDNHIFKMIKFRSMKIGTPIVGTDQLEQPKEFLTSIGSFLRRSSADELPQLWNVICGEMSLIGPRPLLVEYLCRYNSHQARRHEVRPGITGWAQVNGRNAIGWEDRFNLDVFYVDQLSAWLDLRILIMTVLKVLQGSDVNSDNHVTMERFQGSPEPDNSQHN